MKKAEARDIVILFRAVKRRGEVMSRALRNCSIESHVEGSEEYFDTIEIGVALNLLICIDNMKRDVPLISVLHSEVFGFTPEEMAGIRTAHSEANMYERRAPYWKAFEWYAESGSDGALRKKAEDARAKLLEWRMLSRMLPLADFVWKVLVDSGYYRMAGAILSAESILQLGYAAHGEAFLLHQIVHICSRFLFSAAHFGVFPQESAGVLAQASQLLHFLYNLLLLYRHNVISLSEIKSRNFCVKIPGWVIP
jgi:ATP-dependent exoDNAse (exonuclease V) beta subunit